MAFRQHGRVSEIGFAVNLGVLSDRQEFRAVVRRADELGFDVLAAPDHLGGPAPFTTLAAAAELSDRLRLRSYVLNDGFWNQALLAREVASLDVLSGGRVELGLGAGHMKNEHDDAGLPWPPLRERVAAMEHTLIEVRRRLADDAHQPPAVQRPVPVLVGAMSEPGLAVAARHADIVGFAGARQLPGAPIGTFTLYSAAETAQRVDAVRREAAGRPYRSDVLLQVVELGDPEQSAERLVAAVPHLSVEQVLDTPFALLARDADEAAAELHRRRAVYGFDCVTTHQPSLAALGAVIAAYRA